MAEYIGCKISLISKRDIRYVGTLHEINPDNSTVALEQVKSFGTEGRSPGAEVAAQDNIYEYIVFRGSDVKDLRIEKEPEEKPAPPPQPPDDPAILGNARPTMNPSVQASQNHPLQQQPHASQPSSQQYGQQQRSGQPSSSQGLPRFQQYNHFPSQYPPNQRFGQQGPPQAFPPYGYQMPYSSPPQGWYPPPGQGFPYPNSNPLYGPPGQFGAPGQPPMQQGQSSKPATPAEIANNIPQSGAENNALVEKKAATVKLPSSSTAPAPPLVSQNGPTPPAESKPNINEVLAPPALDTARNVSPTYATTAAKTALNITKSGHIQPAIPLTSPAAKPKLPINNHVTSAVADSPAATPRSIQAAAKSEEEKNREAREAVAGAMAKIETTSAQQMKQLNGDSNSDNLAKKVNDMRLADGIRTSRQPGTGGYVAGRGRGSGRGNRAREDHSSRKIEVPQTDYDFAEANAKFNKQDLVKEAIATGSPIGSPATADPSEITEEESRRASEIGTVVPAALGYSKSTSFFDNLSSESKDKEDKRLGGREFRNEEQKKNLETFGQGSVDNGYRGGYRGRGRGRGGYRGPGRGSVYSSRGRGSTRGRGGAVVAEG